MEVESRVKAVSEMIASRVRRIKCLVFFPRLHAQSVPQTAEDLCENLERHFILARKYWDNRRQDATQILAGKAFTGSRNGFGCALRDDSSAASPALGAQVDDPIGSFNDVQIVFDDQQGVAGGAQFEKNFEQFRHVMKMQAGGRFVEDVEGVAGGFAGEFGGKLDAVRFAAAQGGGGLAEADVAQANVGEGEARLVNLRDGAEKCHRFIDRHVQHVGDVHAFVTDFQSLAVVTASVAGFAGHIDRRKEVHFYFDEAVALAFLAASALDVEAEPARFVAAYARRGQLCEQVPDMIEHAGVGRGIAAGRAANRRLINHD